MKKIVFIANMYILEMEMKRFVKPLQKDGYVVELWDVGAIWGTGRLGESGVKSIYHRIKTMKEFYYFLFRQNMKKTIFVYLLFRKELYYSQALIHLMGGKYCMIDEAALNMEKNYMIHKKNLRNTPKHWMDSFLPAYSFLGSKHSTIAIKSDYELKNGNNIYLHTLDYDKYLRCKANKQAGNVDEVKPYVLFLDQNYFYHSDIINVGGALVKGTALQFYSEVCAFLDEIERQFGMDVIIANHPTADERNSVLYEGRKTVQGNTCEYVKNAEFVIASMSGAIGYAVIHKKQTMIFTNNQLKRSGLWQYVQMIKARLLKAPIINISKDVKEYNLKDYLVDTSQCDEYMEYLTADVNNEELFADVVVRYLKTL